MGQTLTNGIYLPDEGERNSYSGLEVNWRTLDALILTVNGKAAPNVANTWTAAQTFTAGIAGDLTGNVTGDLTGTAAKAIADEDGTSIKTGYVNVAGNQTVTGDKSFTGSNTFNNILPNAANTYSLGSSSYQWSSVYAQTYYYNGTAWGLDKANVWTGSNTFQTTDVYYSAVEPRYVFKSLGLERGVQPSWHGTATGYWFDKNSDELGFTRFVLYNNGTQTYEIGLQNKATNGDLSPTGSTISTSFHLQLFKTGDSQLTIGANALAPAITNSYDLGTSTNKWKTLNGVNPGALSLPAISGCVNIDTTNWDKTGADNSYTPVIDGWILLRLNNVTGNYIFVANSAYSLYSNATGSGSSWFDCFVPVRKDVALTIQIKGTNLVVARFYPALGNV